MAIPWKRVIRWAGFLGCLILLGVGIYRFEAEEPRWRVQSAMDAPLHFSADGRWFYTSPFGSWQSGSAFTAWAVMAPNGESASRFQKWNAATGQCEGQYPKEGRATGTSAFSTDGRYFAVVCTYTKIPPSGEERFVCLVDLQSGDEKQLPIPCPLNDGGVAFSPCGRYFVLGVVNQFSLLQIYASATGELVDERWCNGLVGGVTFTSDYLLYSECDEGEPCAIVLWSLRERKIAATLASTKGNGVVSADGKFLVASGDKESSWIAWNLRTHKVESTWNAENRILRSSQVDVMGDRHLACFVTYWYPSWNVEAWDIGTGKRIGTSECDGQPSKFMISCDGRFMAAYTSPLQLGSTLWNLRPESVKLRALQLPTLKKSWGMDDLQSKAVDFTKDGQRIIVVPMEGSAIQIRDVATGVVQQTISVDPNSNDDVRLSMTPDGKHLCIQCARSVGLWAYSEPSIWRRLLQWVRLERDENDARRRDGTIVYDLESNRERMRLRDWRTTNALLSDDGTTLITTHDDGGRNRMMCCWDVGSAKPLRWPIAIPAVFGMLLWGLAKRVECWRKRRVEVQQPAAKSA